MADQVTGSDPEQQLDAALHRFERAHETFQAARAEVHEAFIQLNTAEQTYGRALDALAVEMAEIAAALQQMGKGGTSND